MIVLAVALVVVFAGGLVLGVAVGGAAAHVRPVPAPQPPRLDLVALEMAHMSDALSQCHRDLFTERAYSAGLSAELVDQRLENGALRARLDLAST